MKTDFLIFFCLLSLVIILSCNKNNDNEVQKLDPEGDCFTAKIDGEFFNSDNVTGTQTA